MKHLFFRSIVTVVALALLLGLFIGHGAAAPMALATITVDTTDDELNNDGDCSLREAIQAANTDSAIPALTRHRLMPKWINSPFPNS